MVMGLLRMRLKKALEDQVQKLDAQYDICNEVMANGEVSGFPKELLVLWFRMRFDMFCLCMDGLSFD